MEFSNTTWSYVVNDVGKWMAPIEWISRKILYWYGAFAFIRVTLAILGGLAIVVTILELFDRKQDRLLRDLDLFIQVKEQSNGKVVSQLLTGLIKKGMSPASIPLSNVNLQGSKFEKINLNGAFMTNALLQRADLNNSTMDNAVFDGAFFNEADLSYSSLKNAEFTDSKMAYVILNNADLSGAQMSLAFMFGANLSNSILIDANLFGARIINANLIGMNGSSANFAATEFNGSDLSGAILREADLSGANFTNAVLASVDVSGATFETYDENDDVMVVGDVPLTAKITVEQLLETCADEGNPPILPRGNIYSSIIIQPCS